MNHPAKIRRRKFFIPFSLPDPERNGCREGVPPYRVFSDAVLHDMAHIRPRSQEAMMGIRGIGPARWERYGSFFLKALAEAEKEEKEAICQTENFTSGAFLLYLEHVRTQIACTEGISPDESVLPKYWRSWQQSRTGGKMKLQDSQSLRSVSLFFRQSGSTEKTGMMQKR